MNRKTFVILSIFLLAALTAGIFFLRENRPEPPIPATPAEKPVASVNGQVITVKTFQTKFTKFATRLHLPWKENTAAAKELKMSFLNKLIETELLLQEARMRNLTVTDDELNREINLLKEDYPKDTLDAALVQIGMKLDEWKSDRREKLLIDKVIEKEVDSVIHVSDDDVKAYYDSHKKDFKVPLMVKARQIVVATEAEAKSLRSRLLRGGNFAKIAEQFSLSPDAKQGGELGVFARGQMPEEFDKVVFRYRVGTISRVVHSPYGFHVFQVEDRIPPHTRSLKDATGEIRKNIFQSRQESFFHDWMDALKKGAKITIYPDNLQQGPQ
ncbi:foldase protein PrsA 1 precursor [bacterium BMS3Abin14]|nr:foldase protein PrsA 1 precursor [bacterium BMS3Abin14]